MSRIREQIVLIENVASGQRALIQPSVGRTWLDVHVEHLGVTLAQMKNIKVVLVHPERTVTLQEFTDGIELNEFNKRYGRHVVAGTLSIYFRRPELENEAQSMATALGTGGLQGLRIEFDIDSAATNPVIRAWGRKVANRGVDQGLLPYIKAHNIGGQASGDNYFDSIEKRDRISAIHVLNTGVDELELKVDDAVVYALSRARSNFDDSVGGRVPYAAARGMCIDFTTAGVLDESLVMQSSGYQVQQMRLTSKLNVGYSGTTRILVEYLSTFASVFGANVQKAA